MTAPKGAVLKYSKNLKIFRLKKGFKIVVILFLLFIMNQCYNNLNRKFNFVEEKENDSTGNGGQQFSS